MDQERTTRSLRAVAVAVTVGVVTYFLMRNSNWAPDDPTAESGGQGSQRPSSWRLPSRFHGCIASGRTGMRPVSRPS